MKIYELESSLYCSQCHDETVHRIQYLNQKIHSTQCTVCRRKMQINLDPKKELYKEIYKRIQSKPLRVTQESRENPVAFIGSLPKRVLSKPYRLKRYVNETRQALRKFKNSK